MSPKKQPKFHLDWKMILAGGFVTVFVTGGIFVYLRDHLAKIWAAPQEIESLEEGQKILIQQTATIGDWVEQQEAERELKKKAPLGWIWSEKDEVYVIDPNYKTVKSK